MMVITYPTHKRAIYMGKVIDIPLWVKYLASYPNAYGTKSANLIGFSHKPKFTNTGIWTIDGRKNNKRQEQIGIIRNYCPARNEIENTLSEVMEP